MFTRPDIAYAVQRVCLFMHDPREIHMHALERILRYVQGTITHGLQLYPSATTSLIAYTNADWGGCPDTRRPTSGYCIFLGDNLIFGLLSDRGHFHDRVLKPNTNGSLMLFQNRVGFGIYYLNFIVTSP